MSNILKLYFILFLATITSSCFIPPPDALYSYDQLIEKTQTILLIQKTDEPYTFKSRNVFLNTNKGNFKVIEVLKGRKPKKINLLGVYKTHYNNDFNNHSDYTFWNSNTGRTPIKSGECGPSHVYELNQQYLLFVESQSNMKSAEIINSKSDKWYNYVKNSLK